MTSAGTTPGTDLVPIDLAVTGMTCASCATRIEKKLNRLDGVTATVNYATEKASVDFDTGRVSPDQLVEAVASIGYGAVLPHALPDTDPADERLADLLEELESRLLTADVGVAATQALLGRLHKQVARNELKDEAALLQALRVRMLALLSIVNAMLV